MFSIEMLIVFVVVALVCAIGFKMYIWFFSIGYGLSIAAVGVCLMLLFRDALGLLNIVSCALLIVYGARLGGYLLLREMKSASYHKKIDSEIASHDKVKFFAKVMIWLSCSVLYILMTAPIFYHFKNGVAPDACFIVGLAIMLVGIVMEVVADAQKTAAKKKQPERFCDTGLFRFVRCPNYLGELILWTGVLIAGVTSMQGVGQWIIAVAGYIGIVYVMFSGARRLELRQERTYGNDNSYQAYVAKVPILLPFIPLHSVKKHKWLVA